MASIKKRVNQMGETSYLISVFIGRDANGKQISKCMTWKPSAGMKPSAADKQAEKEATLFEEKVKIGAITIDGSMKFADYAAKWLEMTEMRPITRANREYIISLINQAIGHIPLEKLRPEHLQQFYKDLKEHGYVNTKGCAVSPDIGERLKNAGIKQITLSKAAGINKRTISEVAQGKRITHRNAKRITDALEAMGVNVENLFIYDYEAVKLSNNTIRSYHQVVAAILNSAKKSRILPHSITEYMTPPKRDTPEAQYLDDEQAREYLLLLLNEPDIKTRTALIILLFTGMRRSELCGLEWRDIDFLDSRIYVRRSSHYAPKHGVYEAATKTKSSMRSIPVMPFMLEVLRQYRAWKDEQAAALGDLWNNEKDRLFTNIDGSPINPNNIGDWVSAFHKRTGTPRVNPHSLRHPYVKSA